MIQYFTGEEEAGAEKDGHLIEFLFSTLEPVVLDMMEFNESEDTSGDLWCEVIRFGSSKRESSLGELQDNLESINFRDPRKANEVLKKLESTFQALEDMGHPLSARISTNGEKLSKLKLPTLVLVGS